MPEPLKCTNCGKDAPFLVTRVKRTHDSEIAMQLCDGCVNEWDNATQAQAEWLICENCKQKTAFRVEGLCRDCFNHAQQQVLG